MINRIYYDHVPSPIGGLMLMSNGEALTAIYPESHRRLPRPSPDWQHDATRFTGAREQLRAYFAGELLRFELALVLNGTPFQQRVWAALVEIEFGKMTSYVDLARRIGHGQAVRAVGGAVARNPLSIIVPCHRVVGADGSLTGYASGLVCKQWLIRHEAERQGKITLQPLFFPKTAIGCSPGLWKLLV